MGARAATQAAQTCTAPCIDCSCPSCRKAGPCIASTAAVSAAADHAHPNKPAAPSPLTDGCEGPENCRKHAIDNALVSRGPVGKHRAEHVERRGACRQWYVRGAGQRRVGRRKGAVGASSWAAGKLAS